MRVRPWHQTVWDWRAAAQFICGGTGSGLMVFTALASYWDKSWLWRTGPFALAFVAVGLLFVWSELGRKLRALFVIRHPQTSWMTREALFSTLYIGVGLVAVLLTSPTLALLSALFGSGYLFSQARILFAARGIPAWRDATIVPLIFTTGLAEGAAFLLIAGVLFNQVLVWFPWAALLLVGVRFLAWRSYYQVITKPGNVPLGTYEVITESHNLMVTGGHLVPFIVLVVGLLLPGVPGNSAYLLGGLGVLVGGWVLKFTIIARAAYNQGFAITRAPARTPGMSKPGAKPGWETPEKAGGQTSPSLELAPAPTKATSTEG